MAEHCGKWSNEIKDLVDLRYIHEDCPRRRTSGDEECNAIYWVSSSFRWWYPPMVVDQAACERMVEHVRVLLSEAETCHPRANLILAEYPKRYKSTACLWVDVVHQGGVLLSPGCL